jgi:transcriptional regulator GlxA family with amidase domain
LARGRKCRTRSTSASFASRERAATATTHWGSIPELQNLGGDTKVVTDQRWVHDGNVITAAGVSAGIDMALYLISLLKDPATAKRVQQMMEYYPKPPVFDEVPA